MRVVGERSAFMLVTFEGLECAGKSSLIREVAAALRGTLPQPVLHLADVSQAPTGRVLGEAFGADEIFGEGNSGSRVVSHCLALAADLFYFDGALIAPMVAAGGVVLKERHVDTLISYLGPALARQEGWSDERAVEWLSKVVAPLQVRPELTILVEAPFEHRERRLRERASAAGVTVSDAAFEVDRAAFRVRGEWYERLRMKDARRWSAVANPDGALATAADQATALILARLQCRRADANPL